MRKDVLVVEISGKRAGDAKKRPTERFRIDHDKVIISNNSEGYITDWDVVNVPQEYVEWYKENCKTSDNAWYAPMNRSYAIKYAKEHGYKYCVQLDDNIVRLELAYLIKGERLNKRYRARADAGSGSEMFNDFIEMLCLVLDETNAGLAGCSLNGIAVPESKFLAERYCYSLFAVNVERAPQIFHGDFEDDIEFRLKLQEMGSASVCVLPLRYGKTGQRSNKDETGNRAAYTEAGLKRGDTMRRIHGDVYSAGYSSRTASVKSKHDGVYFKHKIKPFKCGVMVRNIEPLKEYMAYMLKKYAEDVPEKLIWKEKKRRV